MKLIEAEQPGILRDVGGDEPDRISLLISPALAFCRNSKMRSCTSAMNSWKWTRRLRNDRRCLEEQIHSAWSCRDPDLAENIEALDRAAALASEASGQRGDPIVRAPDLALNGLVARAARARVPNSQRARRFASETMLGEPLLELREPDDDRLLGASRSDRPGCDARGILQPRGSGHEPDELSR